MEKRESLDNFLSLALHPIVRQILQFETLAGLQAFAAGPREDEGDR
jgi:hypothetical protein